MPAPSRYKVQDPITVQDDQGQIVDLLVQSIIEDQTTNRTTGGRREWHEHPKMYADANGCRFDRVRGTEDQFVPRDDPDHIYRVVNE